MSPGGEKRQGGIEIDRKKGIAKITLGEEVHELRLDDALGGELPVPPGGGGRNTSKAAEVARSDRERIDVERLTAKPK